MKFLIEGQEEISSPQMEAFLANHRELLACDLAVSADGLQWSPDQPQIEVGNRGMVALQIDIQGPAIDQHSGLYGGLIQNPAQALAHILASFHDSEGRITVDGYYDDAAPITPAIWPPPKCCWNFTVSSPLSLAAAVPSPYSR